MLPFARCSTAMAWLLPANLVSHNRSLCAHLQAYGAAAQQVMSYGAKNHYTLFKGAKAACVRLAAMVLVACNDRGWLRSKCSWRFDVWLTSCHCLAVNLPNIGDLCMH